MRPEERKIISIFTPLETAAFFIIHAIYQGFSSSTFAGPLMKKKKHFSLEERCIIERLVQVGKSNKAIVEVLGRSKIVRISVLEQNSDIRKEIPLNLFVAKVISLQGLNAKRNFIDVSQLSEGRKE